MVNSNEQAAKTSKEFFPDGTTPTRKPSAQVSQSIENSIIPVDIRRGSVDTDV